MADDPLSAARLELGYLRLSADGLRTAPEVMDTDGVAAGFGRAVDALEAVLNLADKWDAESTRPPVRRGYAAEVFRAAITRALTGEASDD